MNLRHASVEGLDARHLQLLEYVDVAFARIKTADLRPCTRLRRAVADQSQRLAVRQGVEEVFVYDTGRQSRRKKVCASARAKGWMGRARQRLRGVIVTECEQLDEWNLGQCQSLSLRNSSFCQVDATYLRGLLFIDIAYSRVGYADLRECGTLLKAVHDSIQEVLAGSTAEVTVVCFKAADGTHDTRDMHGAESVSYGSWYAFQDIRLADGTKVSFSDNKLTTA